MKIDVRKKGKIAVMDLSGKMTIGEGDVMLRESFNELLDDGEHLVVINMLDVPYLDTSGIGEVVACHKRVQDREGTVKLVLKGKPHDLFTLYSLNRIFEIHGDVEDALASFVG